MAISWCGIELRNCFWLCCCWCTIQRYVKSRKSASAWVHLACNTSEMLHLLSISAFPFGLEPKGASWTVLFGHQPTWCHANLCVKWLWQPEQSRLHPWVWVFKLRFYITKTYFLMERDRWRDVYLGTRHLQPWQCVHPWLALYLSAPAIAAALCPCDDSTRVRKHNMHVMRRALATSIRFFESKRYYQMGRSKILRLNPLIPPNPSFCSQSS